MAAFLWLAHVGFHKSIGKVVHGVLHLHQIYVAELCDYPSCMYMAIEGIVCCNKL